MWIIKEFKTRKQMEQFINKNSSRIQWEEVFINNGFAIEYRKLRRIVI